MLTATDYVKIQNLLGKYAQYWDNYALDAFAALFTEDADTDFGGTKLAGPAAIRAFHTDRVGSFREARIQRRHLLGSIVISATGTTRATVDLYAQVFSTDLNKTGTEVMPPVQYRGVVVKDARERWRFSNWVAKPDREFPAPPATGPAPAR